MKKEMMYCLVSFMLTMIASFMLICQTIILQGDVSQVSMALAGVSMCLAFASMFASAKLISNVLLTSDFQIAKDIANIQAVVLIISGLLLFTSLIFK